MINGAPMPLDLASIDLSDAGTWQFFERENGVHFAPGSGRTGRLLVRSMGPEPFTRSDHGHFAVSMFALDTDDPEARRLPDLERSLQPMLDWLSTNHHDFIRLNHFSESLTLLRWLRQQKISPLLIDMDGEDPEIATPDRTVIGEGPRVP